MAASQSSTECGARLGKCVLLDVTTRVGGRLLGPHRYCKPSRLQNDTTD
ncbi:hypothetical protein [Labilithrix luteola]|nr:hypothetical protein [Labilithrix luteola]